MSLIQKEIYQFGPFVVDPAERVAFRDDSPLVLTPKVFDTLLCLVRNAGRVLTKDEILQAVWPDTFVEEVNLAVNISTLRKALGEGPQEGRYIATVPGRGYRFVAEVRTVRDLSGSELLGRPGLDADEMPPAPRQFVEPSQGTRSESKAFSPTRTDLPVRWTVRRLAIAAVPAVLAFLVIAGYIYREPNNTAMRADSPSIAVLPFADLSQNKDQEYFSDGLSEELIDDLTRVPSLRVVARSSAFQFKNKNEDLRLVGRKLGVANILEGTVRKEGDRVRIRVELTKADDGFQLWSETYDRQIGDIFVVQDEIARAVTSALQVKLVDRVGGMASSHSHDTNPEAYQAYLQAQYFLGRGEDGTDLEKALTYADQALNLDPKYAPAFALRSNAESLMGGLGMMDNAEGHRRARGDAQRAIALDPNLAAGYLALGTMQVDYDWDWDGAAVSLRRAAELEPGSVGVLQYRSYLSEPTGNMSDTIDLFKQGVAADPLQARSFTFLGNLLRMAERYDEAEAALQKAQELNPQAESVHFVRGQMLLSKGQPQAALGEFEHDPRQFWRVMGEAIAYHSLGRRYDSDDALRQLLAPRYQNEAAFQIAEVYAYRGESDRAFKWLDRAYLQRDGGLLTIKIEPLLINLRRDSRYADLLRRMHLPK